jgi:cytidine deaminase
METKILDFSKQEDRDFILKSNSSYKKEFEDLCNWPNRSETADQLFENFKTRTFVLGILDNHLVSMAVGWAKKDYLTISDVFTLPDYRGKGLCKAVIGTLLRSFFTYINGGQFKNNLSFEFGVTHDNIAAIKCYEYFGFTIVPDSYTYAKTSLGEEVKRIKMILTKEAYVEKYLLPKIEQKLESKKLHKDNNIVEKLDEMDVKLLEKTREFMIEYCNENHPTAAGMIHKDGHIVFGLSSSNPLGYDVHAEHTVISQARIYDKNIENYIGIVAMSKPKDNSKYRVKSPCGICRELLKFFYPNIYVIVPDNDTSQNVKIFSKYLLPFPYVSTRYPPKEKLEFDYKII